MKKSDGDNPEKIGIESGSQYFRLNKDGSFQHHGLLKSIPTQGQASAPGQQLFAKLVDLVSETWLESFTEFEDLNAMDSRRQALLKENHYLDNPSAEDVLTIWFATHSSFFADTQLPMDQSSDAAQIPMHAAQYTVTATRIINDAFGSDNAENVKNQQDLVDGTWAFYFRNSRYLIPLLILLTIAIGFIVAQ
ncbi:MAG: hypothetical protein NPIRA05_10480 [Nitrospirales bacterium]|nr:MAG: hypothetical protein NPIRA05_10480 [Nitrospirales bacterium]